jgi:hypothetical protein
MSREVTTVGFHRPIYVAENDSFVLKAEVWLSAVITWNMRDLR